jgi:TatD DNase family protein
MELVDVHSHLESERFKKDLDEVVNRAREAGVKFIITSGVNPSTNRESLKLQEKYPDIVKVSFGIYPIDAIMEKIKDAGEESSLRYVEEFSVDKELKWIEENKDSCVAIGECGLDYKVIEGHEEEQKEVFSKVIDLAKKIDKPLVIHSRKAEADAIDMMEEKNCKRVLMHCFNGKKSLIKRCIALGWSFSVPPVITRLEHFKMLVEMVPLKQLLTETDAPYLSHIAGERNESANVAVTIKEIAKIKELSEEVVASQIFKNAKELFKL